jgi:rsbT co-antagonist protein RsbR
MTGQAQPSDAGRFTADDIERRLRFVGLTAQDRERITAVKGDIVDDVDDHVAVFFDHLGRFPEARGLLGRPEIVAEAKRLKREHLIAMVNADYGPHYAEQRFKLGRLYNQAQIEIGLFMGAFHALMASIGARIVKRFPKDSEEAFRLVETFERIASFDLAIIVDAMIADREQTILRQQEAIRELSTPALQVRDRLLILPIIGLLDTFRAKQLTDGLLQAIRSHRAKVVVVDLTGVATVDSKVANHLIQTAAAARLMGASIIITGLSAEVAQSLVTLGVDLSQLNTMGDLQGGLEEAERMLGYTVDRRPAKSAAAIG